MQMSDNFLTKPAAKWIATISAALVTFACCCGVMYALNVGYVISVTGGNVPTGYEESFEFGAELGQSDPLYVLIAIGMFCLPPFAMLPAVLGTYIYMDRYQKRNLPPPAAPTGI
jgi:hypothetical protein